MSKLEGAQHQERAKALLEWLLSEQGNDLSVVGKACTDGYVLPKDWMSKKQAE